MDVTMRSNPGVRPRSEWFLGWICSKYPAADDPVARNAIHPFMTGGSDMKRFIEWMVQALEQVLGGPAARRLPVRVEANRPRRPRR